MPPLVTVVVPTRHRPGLLSLTLRSIVRQSVDRLDIVVVDDGDETPTGRVISALADSRVRLIPNDGPRGASGARNTGVAAARGEWIAFCDDDDVWAPQKLHAQLDAAADARAEWVYAGCVIVDEGLRVLSGSPPPTPSDVARDLVRYNAVPGSASSVLVRTRTLQRVGVFDPDLVTSEDWDLWIRLAKVAGPPACAPDPLVALRKHPGMASRQAVQILADLQAIARRHAIPVDRARHDRWIAWMALEDGRRWGAARHYARAALGGDRRSFARAMVALAAPGTARRRYAAREAEPWARGAAGWLAVLRDASSTVDSAEPRSCP